MLHAGEYAFASRNQPNYAWWRPLAEIVAVAVLTVAFVAVIGVSLEACYVYGHFGRGVWSLIGHGVW